MATINVSNQAQFLSALKAAKGGDTILLADGHYGDLDLKHDFASNVTIKAANPQGAEFTRLGLVGATNITLDGIQFETGLAVKDGSKGIAVLNCDVDGNFYARSVNGLTIDNTDISGGRWGILLNSVQNFAITNSHIHEVGEDLMRITGNSYNGLIENNVISDTLAKKPLHPDIIQFFHVDGVAPHDITIRGNILHDAPDEGYVPAQGIFISDPGRGDQNGGYYNILIEDNLINTAAANTIFVNSGHASVEILNNTLISRDGGGGNIRLIGKVFDEEGPRIDGNVFKTLIDETGAATVLDNFIYGKGADLSKLFTGSDGGLWQSYIPVDGSPIDFGSGYGATARLIELIKAAGGWAALDLDKLDLDGDALPPPPPLDPSLANLTYENNTTYEMTNANPWVAIRHSEAMAVDDGSISLTFNADTVAGKRGLISKGATGNYDDFSAYISDGKLLVSFENGQSNVTISQTGIKANTDYDLLITFDEKKVKVWLDGALVGESVFDIDLSDNSEFLVLGAMNGLSTRGTTNKVGSFFDGTISDLRIYDQALTPAEIAALDDAGHMAALDDISGTSSIFADM